MLKLLAVGPAKPFFSPNRGGFPTTQFSLRTLVGKTAAVLVRPVLIYLWPLFRDYNDGSRASGTVGFCRIGQEKSASIRSGIV